MISTEENVYRVALAEIKKIVNRNMIKLKTSQRIALEEFFYSGKSISQLSRESKTSRSSINYGLRKGIENLKELITEDIGSEEIDRLSKLLIKSR